MLRHDTRKKVTAHWQHELGRRYSQMGRPAEAVPAAEEAVEIRRELEAARPGRHRADLAVSLGNLGVWTWQAGSQPEALAPTIEAIALYRPWLLPCRAATAMTLPAC